MLRAALVRVASRPTRVVGRRGAQRTLFIQTETTPNPESLKFKPGRPVLDAGGTREYKSRGEAAASPLAKRLFQTDGVVSVFLAADFVAVNKAETAEWAAIKPQIFASIMDFYAAGEPVVSDESAAEADSLTIHPDDPEVVQMIKELLEMRIRPSVQEDGGDITFVSFDDESGVVLLQMQGSCSGCPSSSVTLKAGIENMLMHYIPEVQEVRAVGMDNDPQEGFHDLGEQ